MLSLDEAAAELRALGVLAPEHGECVPFHGGTESVIGAAQRDGRPDLVVKIIRPERVAAEALFLRAYAASPLLARLRYVDPARRFLVYDYVAGERPPQRYTGADKARALRRLANDLVAHYLPVTELAARVSREAPEDAALLPWLSAPRDHTWEREIHRAVTNARRRFGDFLPQDADPLVVELAEQAVDRTPTEQLVLLHGDPGPHNFLFDGATLTGVIDPGIHIGAPIYDLARAFFAWPPDLSPGTLAGVAAALPGYPASDLRYLAEDAIPLLYGQTVACLWHHPEDIATYQAAWPEWTALLA